MELNSGLEFGKTQMAAAAAIFASTLLCAVLFALTGITANDFFTFKMHIVAAKILSTNFAAFLLCFPLPIALMAVFAKRMQKASLMIVSTASSLLALIAAMAAFPSLQSLWIPAAFCLFSIPLAIETAFVKYSELKSWITIRTMSAAAGKSIALVSIGLFVLSVATILPQQQQYIEKFEDFVTDIAYGMTSGKSQQALSLGAADLIIETQSNTIDSLLANPAYTKLKEKTDPDVVAFVTMADAAADYLKGPEYRQQIEQQFSQAGRNVMQEIDVMKIIKEQVPFFETVEQLLWVLHAITLVGIFSLLANIICKPMAVAYGLIAEKALSLFCEPGQRPEAPPKPQEKTIK